MLPYFRPMSQQVHIIHAVINDLSGDQRLHGICSSLSAAGYSVTLVGRQLPNSKLLSKRPYQTRRFRLPVHTGKWFYLIYNLRLFFWLLGQKADIITANDLDTLLACYFAARLKRVKLLFDSHELFTEVPELIDRPSTRRIWVLLEKWLVPRLDMAYTVNGSLARIFTEKYQTSFEVIRNVPFQKEGSPRANFPKVLLYQGALNLGRGIDLMIDAMNFLPDYQLWIVGRGDVEDQLKKQAQSIPEGRVVFHGFKPLEELAELTKQAGLGFSLEEDRGANYHYASPNKVYDYLQARMPVIVSDLPEMASLIETWQCGKVLPLQQRSPEKLAELVREIFDSPELGKSYSQNADRAAKELIWEREQEFLLDLYQKRLQPLQ